ncbi:DedA family protein [Candidatus Formimonas warabiya]|uniref:Alkaline phosphatase n=1 Tax=Formimonas warabiya TaxID=1761012 RepID=A0A3G1KN28_FORW1|nr:DedA family protein [Candidatus Formimonas warabiya]ATW23505.1 alkaline phosphatase [Candidatus Formimonas warabiya]
MQEIIIGILNQFGYIGIFLLITIENVFPPIPSEVILTFGGFMTTYAKMKVWGVILAATAGSVMGAIILYVIGRVFHTERLERLFDSKLGKLLQLKKEDVERAEKWFLKRGNKAIFFCRFIPIVRSLISIPAGVARIKFSSFLTLTIIGTFIWNAVLVFLGRIAGNAWETIVHYVDIYAMIAAAFFALVAILIVAIFVKKRFLKRDKL